MIVCRSPADVGEAIVAYLRDGRTAQSRRVFVAFWPPQPTVDGPTGIAMVLHKAFARTGLKPPEGRNKESPSATFPRD